jgi:cation diffusion facilitator CzcD-associated flavoprotein CzcO
MTAQHFDVLIIGAGLSGIGQACQVQAALPNKTIAILERRERLGGTWDLFRYPGVRSDSDMYTFGYNFRPWQEVQSPRRRPVDPRVHRPDRVASTASTRRSTSV